MPGSILDSPTPADPAKDMQRDLARRYQIHGTKVEECWRSFDKGQRSEAMKVGAADRHVLEHPRDPSLGECWKRIPEWNLRDITEPGSDLLLDLIRHRATKSLREQYSEGVGGGPGDAAFIMHSMRVNGLRHDYPFDPRAFSLFHSDDMYGRSLMVTDPSDFENYMSQPHIAGAIQAGLCVSQETGQLIIERQFLMLSLLDTIIEDILEIGLKARATEKPPKKHVDVARDAMSKLSIVSKPKKLGMDDILASALDQKSCLNDFTRLCFTEPSLLALLVNQWFYSIPEIIPDEVGRMMPHAITDKYISIAIFDLAHNLITGNSIWDYLYRLLQLLSDETSDTSRRIILQEISNVSHLEYRRVQKVFKRFVQAISGVGHEYFKRQSGVYDNGVARVTLKSNPEALTAGNPQLHYVLRLCQSETTPSRAVTWMKKLDDLQQLDPTERDKLSARELEVFSDLAVIASFIESLSDSLPLPAIHLKKGQIFISRSKSLAAELDPLKMQLDLSEFVVPIDNLKEPGIAAKALDALDQFVAEKTGTGMEFLYEDVTQDSIKQLQEYLQQQKTASQTLDEPVFRAEPIPEIRVQQRRQKNKTRPAHSSILSIEPTDTAKLKTALETSPQVFQVKKETFEVFSAIFSEAESHESITWVAFESAMADLSFSVQPKFGSVFTFYPPETMNVRKCLTIHRPHKSLIEGHLVIFIANRLKRTFGWGEQSFEVA